MAGAEPEPLVTERQKMFYRLLRCGIKIHADGIVAGGIGGAVNTSSIHLGSFQEHMFHELDGVIVIGSLQDEALTNFFLNAFSDR
jgi:hypothetical protein